jgi:hypothetical protein
VRSCTKIYYFFFSVIQTLKKTEAMNAVDKDLVVQENLRRRSVMDEYSKKPLERAVFDDKVPESVVGPDIATGICLYNIAHQGRSPVPKSLEDPALRLLGIFRTADEAILQATKLATRLCKLDYWITPVGQWFLMHTDRDKPQEYIQEIIEERLVQNQTRRKKDFEQLRIAHDKKLQSKTSYQKNERDLRRKEKTKEAPGAPGAQESSSIPEITQKYVQVGQRFAVISVLQDKLHSTRIGKKLPEPMVRVYGAFDSKKTAKAFIADTLAPHIGDFDIDIVDMYAWLHPHSVDPDLLEEQFRDPEINNIMNHAKDEKKNSKAFRERCALLDKEPDMPHVTGRDTNATLSLKEIEAPGAPEAPKEPGSVGTGSIGTPDAPGSIETLQVSDEDFGFLKREATLYYNPI